MSATHDPNITIQISRALISPAFGILTPAYLTDVALNGSARFEYFANSRDVSDALDAGRLTAQAAAALNLAFSQSRRAQRILVIRLGGDTVTDALTDAENLGADFYSLTLADEAAAGIIEASTWIESRRKILISQSADADWLTAGFPSAFSAIESNRRSPFVYESQTTTATALTWAANRLSFDPNITSAPFTTAVSGIAPALISTSQASAVQANGASVALPFGAAEAYIDPAENFQDLEISGLVTEDWLYETIRREVADYVVNENTAGRKIPVSRAGGAAIVNILESIGKRGVTAGHFEGSEALPDGYAAEFVSADRGARKLTFRASFFEAKSARLFDFNLEIV